jgi:hypothetical protein
MVNGRMVSAVSTADTGKSVHDEIDGGRIFGVIFRDAYIALVESGSAAAGGRSIIASAAVAPPVP